MATRCLSRSACTRRAALANHFPAAVLALLSAAGAAAESAAADDDRGEEGARESPGDARYSAGPRRRKLPPLDATLVPIVRVYESLDELLVALARSGVDGARAQAGQDQQQQQTFPIIATTRDLRRTVKLLLRGYRLRDNIRIAVQHLPAGPARDDAWRHGVDAAEYLAQIISYYDPVSPALTPQLERFARRALDAGKRELAAFLRAMPDEAVARARRTVHVVDVAAFESM